MIEIPPKDLTNAVIVSDPETLNGTPVFVGTRVPVKNLWDYLEAGHSLNRFLRHFPTVSREQAQAALRLSHQRLIENSTKFTTAT